MEWNKPVWEHDLKNGLRMLRLAIDTHLITAHHALPLLIERPGGLLVEVTDGTAGYNAKNYRLSPSTSPRWRLCGWLGSMHKTLPRIAQRRLH